jgi:Domain of unknown function (DUF4375)
MRSPIQIEAVVVSDESFRSEEPGDLVESNVSFVNALFDEYLNPDEVSLDALRSYYVDYYLAEVNNGGFSQFVYNSGWNPQVVTFVRDGLREIKASRHLALFEEAAALVEGFGHDRLADYFASEYFGENDERDELNGPNDRFCEIQKTEDLLALNAAWLRTRPNLGVLTLQEMEAEVRQRGQRIPDRELRIAEALAKEPRYMKLIRALCERAGHKLDRFTAGDFLDHDGVRTMRWHFLTDRGHHHMVYVDGKAMMLRGFSTTDRVCEMEAPEAPEE